MVEYLKISNFYSIREAVTLSFEATKEKAYTSLWAVPCGKKRLLKMILLYGQNGSGKTTILTALFVLKMILTQPPLRSLSRQIVPFAFDDVSKSNPTKFELAFYINDIRYVYKLSVNPSYIDSEELTYYPQKASALIYRRNYDPVTEVSSISFGKSVELSTSEKKILEKDVVKTATLLATYGNKNMVCKTLKTVLMYFQDNFFGSINTACNHIDPAELYKDVCLQQIAQNMFGYLTHSNISDIKVAVNKRPIPEEYKNFIKSSPMPDDEKAKLLAEDFVVDYERLFSHATPRGVFELEEKVQSTGTLAFLDYLALLYVVIRENKLAWCDEFGEGIHEYLLEALVELFLRSSAKSQLVIATHNISLLEYDKLRHDAVQIIEKNEYGETSIEVDRVRRVHKNVSLAKAYAKGQLFGIPSLHLPYEKTKDDQFWDTLITKLKERSE